MSTTLYECVTFTEASVPAGKPRVDREAGVIHGVKVLGWKSLNGREYDPAGVDPALYEGRKVCVDHARPGTSRSSRDVIGVLEGCRREAGGIYADRLRLFHPAGDFEQRLMGAADVAPSAFGLSHTAKGRERAGSGGAWIEKVERVETVDVVDDPASVAGLYESRGFGMKRKIKDLVESLKAKRPGYSRCLSEMAEAGILGPEAEMEAPMEEPAGDEPADHKAALMDALKALCDEADTLDEGELMKKFKAILKLIKGDSGGGGGSSDDEPTEESRKLKAQNAALLAEKLVRKAAGAAGVALSEALIEHRARPGMTEAQAAAVIKELGGAGGGQRPRSAGPLPAAGGQQRVQESRRPGDDELKEIAARINGR